MSINNVRPDSEIRNEQGDEKSTVKKKKTKKNKDQDDKEEVDTSNFTIEERLVAAVWVHERRFERISIAQIKVNFRLRFGKPPPTKNTLYFWEKKIFSTGKVMDAKRSGRPCRRKAHIPSVEASLKQAPGLSLRARAEQLCLPRTTLKKILKDDLNLRNNANHVQNNHNNSTLANENANNMLRPIKPPVSKQNTDQQSSNIQCNNLPPPPSYSYPEAIGPLPISAFQHYLTYPNPNNNHHQSAAIVSTHSKMPVEAQNHNISNITPHMMTHQQHTTQINHHSYLPNQVVDKTHLVYAHNGNHNNTRNQMNQTFHS